MKLEVLSLDDFCAKGNLGSWIRGIRHLGVQPVTKEYQQRTIAECLLGLAILSCCLPSTEMGISHPAVVSK